MSKPGPKPIDAKVRFARYFETSATGCWEWRGARFGSGYGQFYAGRDGEGMRKNIHAHRFAYEIRHGEIAPDQHVLHRCDNPPCVNPDHLFAGTRSDNMQDMFSKGRGKPRGKTQLTPDQVTTIRAALKSDPSIRPQVLAHRFGVSASLIAMIRRKEVWTSILQENVNV